MTATPPRLHQSTAKILLEKSPAHAIMARQKREDQDEETTAALLKGTLVDALVFGIGLDVIVPIAFDNYRTKGAQIQRDEAIVEGKTPVLTAEYDRLQKVADVIRKDLAVRGFPLQAHESQVSFDWEAPNGCPCSGKLDHLFRDRALILDLKTTRSAAEPDIQKSFTKYGYDIQQAAYIQAVETMFPTLQGKVKFVFYFTETEEPYGSRLVECSGQMKYLGNLKWMKACRIWKQCLDTGVWPGYSPDVFLIEPKPWEMELKETGGENG